MAEGLGVIILRTCASCGGMSFRGEGVCLKGCLGFDSRVARSRSLEVTLVEDLRDYGGRVVGRPPLFLNYILAFALQVSKIASVPNLS